MPVDADSKKSSLPRYMFWFAGTSLRAINYYLGLQSQCLLPWCIVSVLLLPDHKRSSCNIVDIKC
jgi:hypothetical protein